MGKRSERAGQTTRLTRKSVLFALLVTGVLLGSLKTILIHPTHHHLSRGAARASVAGASPEDLLVPDSDLLPSARHLYPYSIIPGGVQSANELHAAMQNDPVVARHYADFDVANAHVVALDHDQMVYVSYRMGQQVFWTSHPLKLFKGETVITDGIHEARTRCGNRLSETPQAPLAAQQPALEVFNRLAPAGTLYALNLPALGDLTPLSPYSPAGAIHPLPGQHNDFASPFFMFAPGPGFSSGPGSLFTPGPGPLGSGSGTGSSGTGGGTGGAGSPSGPGSSGGSGSSPGSGGSGTGSPGGSSGGSPSGGGPTNLGTPTGPTGPGSPGGSPIATPEPGTLLLLSTGLSGLLIRRTLKRARSQRAPKQAPRQAPKQD